MSGPGRRVVSATGTFLFVRYRDATRDAQVPALAAVVLDVSVVPSRRTFRGRGAERDDAHHDEDRADVNDCRGPARRLLPLA